MVETLWWCGGVGGRVFWVVFMGGCGVGGDSISPERDGVLGGYTTWKIHGGRAEVPCSIRTMHQQGNSTR